MQLQTTFPKTELKDAFPANAKILFNYLEINTKFSDWINRRINKYDFIENQDYIIKNVYIKGRPRKEYYITLNMAKELCMIENNTKGKEARRYFIDCEQHLKTLELEQQKARFKTLEDENKRLNSLNHHQAIGYKSQLSQQKKHFGNEIKALKYDLEKSFKNKKALSSSEYLKLKQILAKDFNLLSLDKLDIYLFSQTINNLSHKLDKKDNIAVYKIILEKLQNKLKYYKNLN